MNIFWVKPHRGIGEFAPFRIPISCDAKYCSHCGYCAYISYPFEVLTSLSQPASILSMAKIFQGSNKDYKTNGNEHRPQKKKQKKKQETRTTDPGREFVQD